METNNQNLQNCEDFLSQELGKPGTSERAESEDKAIIFYAGSLLRQARKEAKVSQAELAKRINTTRARISQIENGELDPGMGTFYRILLSLGMDVEITRPMGFTSLVTH